MRRSCLCLPLATVPQAQRLHDTGGLCKGGDPRPCLGCGAPALLTFTRLCLSSHGHFIKSRPPYLVRSSAVPQAQCLCGADDLCEGGDPRPFSGLRRASPPDIYAPQLVPLIVMFALLRPPYLVRGPPLAFACADPRPGLGGRPTCPPL